MPNHFFYFRKLKINQSICEKYQFILERGAVVNNNKQKKYTNSGHPEAKYIYIWTEWCTYRILTISFSSNVPPTHISELFSVKMYKYFCHYCIVMSILQ